MNLAIISYINKNFNHYFQRRGIYSKLDGISFGEYVWFPMAQALFPPLPGAAPRLISPAPAWSKHARNTRLGCRPSCNESKFSAKFCSFLPPLLQIPRRLSVNNYIFFLFFVYALSWRSSRYLKQSIYIFQEGLTGKWKDYQVATFLETTFSEIWII